LDNGPGLGQEERLLETLQHLTENPIGNRQRELICFEKLPGGGIPASKHGSWFPFGKILERPRNKIGTCGPPWGGDHIRVMSDKGSQLMKTAQGLLPRSPSLFHFVSPLVKKQQARDAGSIKPRTTDKTIQGFLSVLRRPA
jgi:hypothetical protein